MKSLVHFSMYFSEGSPSFRLELHLWKSIQSSILSYKSRVLHVLACFQTQQGWMLTRAAIDNHKLFASILRVA